MAAMTWPATDGGGGAAVHEVPSVDELALPEVHPPVGARAVIVKNPSSSSSKCSWSNRSTYSLRGRPKQFTNKRRRIRGTAASTWPSGFSTSGTDWSVRFPSAGESKVLPPQSPPPLPNNCNRQPWWHDAAWASAKASNQLRDISRDRAVPSQGRCLTVLPSLAGDSRPPPRVAGTAPSPRKLPHAKRVEESFEPPSWPMKTGPVNFMTTHHGVSAIWSSTLRGPSSRDNSYESTLEEWDFPESDYPSHVDSPAHEITEAQRQAAGRLAARYADALSDCKGFQASWRKKHEALVTRRREKERAAANPKIPDEEADTPNNRISKLHDINGRKLSRMQRAARTSVLITQGFANSLGLPGFPGNTILEDPLAEEDSLQRQYSNASGSGASTPRPETANLAASNNNSHKRTSNVSFQAESSMLSSREVIGRGASADRMSMTRTVSELRSSLVKSTSKLAEMRGTITEHAFEITFSLARKHHIPVERVKTAFAQFERFDPDGDGVLTQEEFIQVVRDLCDVPKGGEVPRWLVDQAFTAADSDADGAINFEEFLLWSISTEYAEEILVTDPKERRLRKIAREHKIPLPDVERIKGIFDKFDLDKSGNIDEEEFRQVLYILMKVKDPSHVSQKKLQRYWREVDIDSSGEISFEEFLVWYHNLFDG